MLTQCIRNCIPSCRFYSVCIYLTFGPFCKFRVRYFILWEVEPNMVSIGASLIGDCSLPMFDALGSIDSHSLFNYIIDTWNTIHIDNVRELIRIETFNRNTIYCNIFQHRRVLCIQLWSNRINDIRFIFTIRFYCNSGWSIYTTRLYHHCLLCKSLSIFYGQMLATIRHCSGMVKYTRIKYLTSLFNLKSLQHIGLIRKRRQECQVICTFATIFCCNHQLARLTCRTRDITNLLFGFGCCIEYQWHISFLIWQINSVIGGVRVICK